MSENKDVGLDIIFKCNCNHKVKNSIINPDDDIQELINSGYKYNILGVYDICDKGNEPLYKDNLAACRDCDHRMEEVWYDRGKIMTFCLAALCEIKKYTRNEDGKWGELENES